MCISPSGLRKQQPGICAHGSPPSCATVWSGSPRSTTSQPVLRRVAPRSGRSVRTNCNPRSPFTQSRKPLDRNTQLRLRAAPEQIRRRCRNDEEVRGKLVHVRAYCREVEPVGQRIDDQRFMTGGADLVVREQQFQRVMSFATSKRVGRTFERPRRIYQSKLHSLDCLTS